jgi:hypothetical protein
VPASRDSHYDASALSWLGYTLQYRIMTVGQAGTYYGSGWKLSNEVVAVESPRPPPYLTVTPDPYMAEVTLSWGSPPATSFPVVSFELRVTVFYASGGSWQYSVSDVPAQGTYSYSPQRFPEVERLRHDIRSVDSEGRVSEWTQGNDVHPSPALMPPTLWAPLAGASTHMPRPFFLARSNAWAGSGDGAALVAEVDGVEHSSALAQEAHMFSTSGILPPGTKTVFRPPALAPGAHSIRLCSVFQDGARSDWSELTQFSVLAPPPPVAPRSLVRASDVNALQECARRQLAFVRGGPPSLSPAVAGETPIWLWSDHVGDLRSAVQRCYVTVVAWDPAASLSLPAWVPIEGRDPRADAMEQLRAALHGELS